MAHTDNSDRELLQRRLATFAGLAFGLLGTMNLAAAITIAADHSGWWMFVPHLAHVALLAATWRYLRRGRHTKRRLRLVDVALTVLVPAATAPMALVVDANNPHLVPEVWNVTLSTVIFLVARSAIVPSAAMRTALLHGAAVLPTGAVIHMIYARYPDMASFNAAEANILAWLAMFVAVSAGISHVIYGLHARVREVAEVGPYRLDRKLGEGGMGTVYEATHMMLGRKTAIKLLRADRAGEDALARFEREVQIASRLSHESAAAIYDYGRTGDGVFYYAMELLEGVDLERLVARDGPLPPAKVVHILHQVSSALAEAHRAGVIHRDIKPANIMLCERGGVRDVAVVVDFGLVKRLDDGAADGALTGVNQITGTPLYMAPEAILDGAAVDERTDLYALGAVGFFLLTGEAPFVGGGIVEICSHHLHSLPTAPSVRRGEPIGDDLDALILACLAKDPSARPASAAQLAEALAACVLPRARRFPRDVAPASFRAASAM